MQFTVQYPLVRPAYDPGLTDARTIARFAETAEAAGFDAIAFTEHPAPSHKWVASGGHDAYDPITALAACAATTDRIALLPYALVLPYRNPLLLAKALATLDLMSGGRVKVGVGTGYLRSEFAAVGVPFEERNQRFDEAVEAMIAIWTTDAMRGEGLAFKAVGQTSRPRPEQIPHPPFWIAGNSRRARERAAAYGEAWMPLLLDAERAATVRSPAIPTTNDLAVLIEELHELVAAAGRPAGSVAVQAEGAQTLTLADDLPLGQHVDYLHGLESVGVSWFVVDTPGTSVAKALGALDRYGDEVIGPVKRAAG
ncbi:MAG: TIGR03619 family F420-dependent LLM class oxidoreductase [Ilumatobacteraceae bacterium]